MKRNYFLRPCFLSACIGVFCLQQAQAEFTCSAEVSYKWVKQEGGGPAVDEEGGTTRGATETPEADATTTDSNSEKPTQVPEAATPTSSKQGPSPSNMRFALVERNGKDEVSARSALHVEVGRQKARASERCRRDHENFGDCLATKLSAKASILNSLGFSTRAQVEKAITEECRAQQGTCLAVEASEPVCREVAPATKEGQAAPAPEADTKAEGAAKGEAATKGDAKGKPAKKK